MNADDLTNTNTDQPILALAQMLKASGDPLRLEILRILSKDSYGVLELAEIFDIKQSGMSHHLKVLAKANLVSTRREGNSIFYRRAPVSTGHEFEQIKRALFESADQLGIDDIRQNAIDGVYQQRAQTSLAFFSEHSSHLKEQQELIAAFDVYGKHVAELLNNIPLTSQEKALEIGPGHGEMLPILAEMFKDIIALDNNKALLKHAQDENSELNNVAYQHQDTSYCQAHPKEFDVVLANMVLHHTPSPGQIFKDVSETLKPGGSFVVCDLTEHDQDWARLACGDQWLGFTPTDLTEWAEKNQLKEGQSDYFALRNGFQIQIRQFVKD